MIMSREDVFKQILQAIGKSIVISQDGLEEITENTLLTRDLGINLKYLPGPSSFIWNVEQSLQVRVSQMSPPFTHLGGDMVIRDLLDWIMAQLETKEGMSEYDDEDPNSGRLKSPVEMCEMCGDNYHWFAGCMGMCPDCLTWVRNFHSLPNNIKKVAKAVCDAMEEMAEWEAEEVAIGE